VFALVAMNFNLDTDTGLALEATGGTVTVSVSGDIYTVEFTLLLEDGKTATGTWSGPAPVVDI
jgi:hypothetical protein